MQRVRGGLSFWAEVDELAESEDPRWQDVYDMAFRLVEEGPIPAGARHSVWPIWGQWVEGYALDFPDMSGELVYFVVHDPDGGPSFVSMYRIIWFE